MSQEFRKHGIGVERVFRIAAGSGSRRKTRIPAGSEVFIKVIEELHILCGNFKVKNIGILENASMIGRFGNHHQSVLQRPADEDLRR